MTLLIGGYFLYVMLAAEDKSELLIGEASHGHFQIELACSSCHTDAFGGGEVLQNACVNCHGEELKTARDSHPKKKFTDPRNANLLEVLDARYCVSCHTEHQKEQTHPMGLTIAGDYCFHCHIDIGKDRPSHKDLAFDSCASAGCHNFHDNRALFEDFLVANAGGHWLGAVAELVTANHAGKNAPAVVPGPRVDATAQVARHPQIQQQWSLSGHAQAGVDCAGCHSDDDGDWLEKPALAQCQSCHGQEAQGFLAGKHGMRLAAGLPALQPKMSALPFKQDALTAEHGCTGCHAAHEFDTRVAAVEACLSCHDDSHSRAFPQSPHGQLTQRALQGEISWGQAVTCATCHMPRIVHDKPEAAVDVASLGAAAERAVISVEHNQNAMLRPNEKMIRPVCMSCHSLEFSIDALADENLINNNFKGKPQKHIPSIDWAIKRAQ
ncbi:cytochrome c3 family protein [Pseudomaricurvus alcaniphilus]|uniref:cytochrome c3 family protein n=1 Tax=Pseudomaricurvus alcaniphilus TaxID=1166482 RepID=UPI001A9EA4B1|nr:cytochrome c3 family protein [Pseudomaricurvus alcaniphilus]